MGWVWKRGWVTAWLSTPLLDGECVKGKTDGDHRHGFETQRQDRDPY